VSLLNDVKQVARGWRWGRPAALPRSAPVPPLRTEGAFDTEWSRKPIASATRDLLQEFLLMPAFRFVASPTVRGRERLRHLDQPIVIASNHVSHLDTAALIEALPQRFRHKLLVGAAADYFFTGKVRGNIAALVLGAFPVERKRASASSARIAVRLVQEGWNLILFPEGGRSPDGWLQELKPGAAFVAAKAQRPLVPMWITGTEHLLPRGAKRLRRGKVDVLIGDPIFPREGDNARTMNARFEEAITRLATEATHDWWTSQRAPDGVAVHGGPDAARWRRVWERGDAPERPRSRWR
jgi:1-acyl-sn-glycerol-3-phosphate acyltransferase